MKLLNYTTSFFAAILLVVIPLWAALFYFNMLDEIYDSIDDGLDNQKLLIINKARIDTSLLMRPDFDEVDFTIRQVSSQQAVHHHDVYIDTSMYMQNERDFEPVRLLRTFFSHNNQYYELLVYTSMVEEDDLVKQLLYSMIWLYIGLIATILMLNNVLLRKIWRPFYLLLKSLQSFKLDDPKPVSTGKTSIIEFRMLNDVVQKMLQSNIDTFTSQKQFIENAAHELQTPLAISLNKLEGYIQDRHLDEPQSKLLESLMDNILRMQRLNHALLLLFKIENQQFTGSEEVNLNKLLHKIKDDFSDLAEFKKIKINLLEQSACKISMHPDLATIMFTNLLKNALVHNHPDGFVNISISQEKISIENSGLNAPLDEKKIFWRFYKEQNASGSTGLGLAITKAIADRYGFSIAYSYQNKHVITVKFPGTK